MYEFEFKTKIIFYVTNLNSKTPPLRQTNLILIKKLKSGHKGIAF